MQKLVSIILIWFVGVFLLFSLSQARPEALLVATLPLVVQGIVLLILFKKLDETTFWGMSALSALVFLGISSLTTLPMQVGAVMAWIFIATIVLHAILYSFLPKRVVATHTHKAAHESGEHKKHITKLEEELAQARAYANYYAQAANAQAAQVAQLQQVTAENVTTFVRSVEDKCKALNFVIGRVYSDKRGGSVHARSILVVPRELYNEFTQITQDFKPELREKLAHLIKRLQNQLQLLDLPEREVSGLPQKRLTPIIEILAKGDDDPVQTYHVEAKAICQKLLSYLGKTNV